jgi:hypothetical protein
VKVKVKANIYQSRKPATARVNRQVSALHAEASHQLENDLEINSGIITRMLSIGLRGAGPVRRLAWILHKSKCARLSLLVSRAGTGEQTCDLTRIGRQGLPKLITITVTSQCPHPGSRVGVSRWAFIRRRTLNLKHHFVRALGLNVEVFLRCHGEIISCLRDSTDADLETITC